MFFLSFQFVQFVLEEDQKFEELFEYGQDGIKEFKSDQAIIRHIISSDSNRKTGIKELANLIVSESKENEIDPLLMTALIKVLSNFDSKYSFNDYYGLFAMDSETVKELANRTRQKDEGDKLLTDEELSIHLSANYLKHLN